MRDLDEGEEKAKKLSRLIEQAEQGYFGYGARTSLYALKKVYLNDPVLTYMALSAYSYGEFRFDDSELGNPVDFKNSHSDLYKKVAVVFDENPELAKRYSVFMKKYCEDFELQASRFGLMHGFGDPQGVIERISTCGKTIPDYRLKPSANDLNQLEFYSDGARLLQMLRVIDIDKYGIEWANNLLSRYPEVRNEFDKKHAEIIAYKQEKGNVDNEKYDKGDAKVNDLKKSQGLGSDAGEKIGGKLYNFKMRAVEKWRKLRKSFERKERKN